MQIKSIKKQKNGFYKIIGDENIILADDVILKYNILYKKELDNDLVPKLLEENYKYDILNKVIKYISTKIRSRKEINKFLSKYELSMNDQDFIISKLTDLNLLNDIVYAEAYTYDRMNLYHDGPNKIKKDLQLHNISDEIINNEINKIPKDEINSKLTKLICKRINHNTKYAKGELKRKIEHEFINLGYDLSMIDEIFDNKFISLNEDELIEKAYQKLIQKYSKKYNNIKLINVIKQKLYLKGFNIDDINKIINKNL